MDRARTTHEKYLLLKTCFLSCTDQPDNPNKFRSVSGKENDDLYKRSALKKLGFSYVAQPNV